MLKQWSTDLQCRVMDECVQLHGDTGICGNTPLQELGLTLVFKGLYAGTNEIMKEIVARSCNLLTNCPKEALRSLFRASTAKNQFWYMCQGIA